MTANLTDFSNSTLVTNETVTILENGTVSSSFNLLGTSLVGIVIPSSWTAADITIQVSYDNGASFIDHYDEAGIETTFFVASDHIVSFGSNTIAKLLSAQFIQLTSTVPQTGSNKVIQLLSRPF